MKRRSVLPLIITAAVVAAAGYLVWSNLTGRSPIAAASAAVRSAFGRPPASTSPRSTGSQRTASVAAGNPGGAAAGGRSTPQPAAAPGVGRRLRAHPVEVTNVTTGTLQTFVKLTGEVAAATRVDAFPEVGGKVDQINVSVGSRVDPQTVLLTVDPSRPGTRYEPSPLHSPISGTVIDILVKRGQSVSVTTAAVTVATIGDLELIVRLPERYAQIITWGTVGKVSFDAVEVGSFNARVKRLQPVIDPVSRSKEVAFTIPRGTPGIEPGMFGSVELVSREVSDAVIVPFETIVQEAASNYVFVAHDGKAEKRRIEIGMLAGEMVEVRSGLADGETVITSGQSFLEDGSPISVANKTAERIGSQPLTQ